MLFGFGVSLFDAIQVTLWVGVASLGFWGFVTGRRAGYTGWRMAIVVGADGSVSFTPVVAGLRSLTLAVSPSRFGRRIVVLLSFQIPAAA